jgi:hypothetical protein
MKIKRSYIPSFAFHYALHLQSGSLHELYTLDQVPVLVLLFVTFTQTCFVGRFDSGEDRIETCLEHHLHSPIIRDFSTRAAAKNKTSCY